MGLGGFIKAAVGLFVNRNDGVTLTREQADHVQGLVKKELAQISLQMHETVDKGALEGKTVPITTICVVRDGASEEEKAYIGQMLHELIEKYGESMPVNTAHRLSREWAEEETVWSENPGCYERHLQRRDGSPLFTVERSIVTILEIMGAQEKDSSILQQFKKKFEDFYNECSLEKRNSTLEYASSLLQETQGMLEEAAAVGGNLEREVEVLQSLEESLIKAMNESMFDGADLLKQAHNLSLMARVPFFAQSVGKHKCIPENEVVSSLLAEDLDTIETMGFASRSFGPDFKPNDVDIKVALDVAVERGFSRQRAGKILTAWVGHA